VAYDKIALLTLRGLVDSDMLFDFQGEEISKLWGKVQPVVENMRKDGRRNYCRHLKWLSTKWYQKALREHRAGKCPVCKVIPYLDNRPS